MYCKITNKKIKPFMSFGLMPIANGFLKKDNFKKEFLFKMEVGFSNEISLFQLNDHPKPKLMFNKDYPFFTSSSRYMIKHFKNYSNWVKKYYFKNTKKVIEIGSNDGTLLKNFKSSETEILGIEPSKNVASVAMSKKINTINKFFSFKTANSLKKFRNKTDLICGANAICHIPNLNDLIKGIDILLSKKGVFVFEEPYLGSMYEKTSYDQIYDEHIFMFSVSSVKKIFDLYNFDLIDVQKQKTHGGSMRYFVSHEGSETHSVLSNSAKAVKQSELTKKFHLLETYKNFAANVENTKNELMRMLNRLKKEGHTIVGYGASGRANTLIQYCGITHAHLDYMIDDAPAKEGFYTPGSHFEIKSNQALIDHKPDYILVFAWSFFKEIAQKNSTFFAQGGKMIVPLPELKIIEDISNI